MVFTIIVTPALHRARWTHFDTPHILGNESSFQPRDVENMTQIDSLTLVNIVVRVVYFIATFDVVLILAAGFLDLLSVANAGQDLFSDEIGSDTARAHFLLASAGVTSSRTSALRFSVLVDITQVNFWRREPLGENFLESVWTGLSLTTRAFVHLKNPIPTKRMKPRTTAKVF